MNRTVKKVGPVIEGVVLVGELALSAVIAVLRGDRMNEIRLRLPTGKRGGVEEVGVLVTGVEKVYTAQWVEARDSGPKRKQWELVEKKGVVRIFVVRTKDSRVPSAKSGSLKRYGFTFLFNFEIGGSKKNPISRTRATEEKIRFSGKKKLRIAA